MSGETPAGVHHRIGSRCTLDDCPETHDPEPPSDVTEDEVAEVVLAAWAQPHPMVIRDRHTARVILAAFHVTRRADG